MVNVARAAYGLSALPELPAAVKGDSGDCVLARALRDITGEAKVHDRISLGGNGPVADMLAELWATSSSGSDVKTPGTLARFFGRFDNGEYPTLVS